MWKQEQELYQRNQLMMKWYWMFAIINLILNRINGYPYMGYLLLTWCIPLLLVTFLYLTNRSQTILMYAIILSMYGVTWIWIQLNPSLLNFIFIWIVLTVSSFYQKKGVILMAGVLTIIITLYSFYCYHVQIFPELKNHHIIILLLFDLILVLFLYYATHYSQQIQMQVEANEIQVGKILHSTKEYLESFLRNTSDALVVFDLKGRVLKVNPAFETIFGWKEWETLGRPLNKIVQDQDGWIERVIQQVEVEMEPLTFDIVNENKEGAELQLNMVISPIRDQEGELVALASLARDITARKKAEEMLLHSEKLAAVGQLAASVTHEIRNPLTVLSGFTQLIAKNCSDPTIQNYCQLMKSEIERIHMIISELLVFSKPQAKRLMEYDVRQLILETVALMEPEARQNQIKLHCIWKGNILPILCEPNALKQVLINLLKNSMEAMPEGGEVKIVAEGNEEAVIISVCDNGLGMDEETMQHISEPFYTKKEQGTGLGMAISQRIITEHGGRMHVESEPNKGTLVQLTLPLCKEQTRADSEEE